MLRPFLLALLLCCTCMLRAQSELFRNLMKQSDIVVHATVVERGRCVRMEATYCTVKIVVKEVFKGKSKTGDTLNLEVTESGLIPLGGKLHDVDTVPRYLVGKEFVFFLKGTPAGLYGGDVEYTPVDDVLGALEPSDHLLFYLRGNKERISRGEK